MSNGKKGIYCIEGSWNHNDMRDRSTILPILDLLDKRGICKYIYRDCATPQELEYYLNKWSQKSISESYPILYLAFHGEEENIFLNNKDTYSMEQIAELLEDKCYGKVIYFASCATLGIDLRKIQTFLERTNAIATIGYKCENDWLISTACDLLVFEALQEDKLDSKGILRIQNKILNDYGNLHRILDLRVVINERMYFPRRRVA
jgi:hypothetical protein